MATSTTPSSSKFLPQNQRPTTPLRRISASSLRASSLSHSRSRPSSSKEFALAHLLGTVQELSDTMNDLTCNFHALNEINESLDLLNENFGSYLYGLRIAAYLGAFNNMPSKENFDLFQERQATKEAQSNLLTREMLESSESESEEKAGNETTFHTIDSESFIKPEIKSSTRGRGSVRGRGTGRPVVSKREAMENVKVAEAIIQLLPIKFREQQPERKHTETVITILRTQTSSLSVAALCKIVPAIPAHRLNDILFALSKAKVVLKENPAGGASEYRLDPNRILGR